jgi:ArsR family transcriptional regulator
MTFDPDDVQLAGRLKALAHPARLTILRALMQAQRCSCGDIVRNLPLAQSTVSQHLKVLQRAGLIRGDIEGPRSCYRVDADVLAAVVPALGSLAQPARQSGGSA